MDWMVLPFNPRTGTPGDYIPLPNGNLSVVTGALEMRQRVFFALLIRKGWIYDENIGSDLWTIPRDYAAVPATGELAEKMAVKALEDQLSGVLDSFSATATVGIDGMVLDVKYRIIATGEWDGVRITQEDLLNG
jgi:hypothetical protein